RTRHCCVFSLLLIPPPPRSPLFPYTTLFRSDGGIDGAAGDARRGAGREATDLVGEADRGANVFQIGDLRLACDRGDQLVELAPLDRKSTRLNSSHVAISYAVFCLKKKKTTTT